MGKSSNLAHPAESGPSCCKTHRSWGHTRACQAQSAMQRLPTHAKAYLGDCECPPLAEGGVQLVHRPRHEQVEAGGGDAGVAAQHGDAGVDQPAAAGVKSRAGWCLQVPSTRLQQPAGRCTSVEAAGRGPALACAGGAGGTHLSESSSPNTVRASFEFLRSTHAADCRNGGALCPLRSALHVRCAATAAGAPIGAAGVVRLLPEVGVRPVQPAGERGRAGRDHNPGRLLLRRPVLCEALGVQGRDGPVCAAAGHSRVGQAASRHRASQCSRRSLPAPGCSRPGAPARAWPPAGAGTGGRAPGS